MTEPARKEYARLLARLEGMIARGEGDGEEAERLRDSMDGPWYRMTDQEQDAIAHPE